MKRIEELIDQLRPRPWIWPLVSLVLTVTIGLTLGVPSAILVLAGSALVAVIAVFWASMRTLAGETPLSGADAYALGAPRAEEEQKRAVLRALKDLEFERSVGKISDEDYQVLVAKYRAEAKRLLRVLDTASLPGRDAVEALVAKRLKREGLAGESAESPEGARQPGRKKRRRAAENVAHAEAASSETPSAEDEANASTFTLEPIPNESQQVESCKSCGTINEPDAVFCKKCGTKRAVQADMVASASEEHT